MSSGYMLRSFKEGEWWAVIIATGEEHGVFHTLSEATEYIEEHPLDRSRDKQRAEKTSA